MEFPLKFTQLPIHWYTLNRKTLTSFVRTKPRGSVVITKPLALRMSLCSQSKLALWHGFISLNHVVWITLFHQGDSELLLFPLQKQMEHNLPCLFWDLLCCYQLYCFVYTRKSCGFVKAKGFIILFWECVDMKTAPPWSHFGSTFFFQCRYYLDRNIWRSWAVKVLFWALYMWHYGWPRD